MKINGILFLGVLCYRILFINQDLEIIKSKVATQQEYQYAKDLDDLHNREKWGFNSRSLGKPEASSALKSSKGINYLIENVQDFNLKTAWIEGSPSNGIGEYFIFNITFDHGRQYGGSAQFNGIIEVFNGYCKTEKIWKQNSRIKSLKMHLNSIAICYIELKDTWQYQSIDISKFFKNLENGQNSNAKYEIKESDQLKFEIVDIYPGDKCKEVALSEFVAKGAPN